MRRLLSAALLAALLAPAARADLKSGDIDLKVPGPLAFGPNNVLFISDLATATVYAVDTRDEAKGDRNAPFAVEKIDAKIAEMIGAKAADLAINDMKVNPATGNLFLSIARKNAGNGLIVSVDRSGKISPLELKNVPSAKFALTDKPKTPNPRSPIITALAFQNNRLLIAGMSNEEFNSSLRSVEFPFKEKAEVTSVEIYHGAHGKWETASPVRTFIPFDINGQAHLLAAYQCTPLVKFNMTDLKAGEKVKGITVAELGNGNAPLDMVVYKKAGKTFVLIANNRRGVMKVTTDGIEQAEAITSRVAGTAGLKYESIAALKDVMQLDKVSDTQGVILAKADQNFDIRTVELP